MANKIRIPQNVGSSSRRRNVTVQGTPNQPLGFNSVGKISVGGPFALSLSQASDTNGVARIVPVATAKTIVDGSATALVDVACASGATTGGTLHYNVLVGDGTDLQSLTGIVTYASVNKSGTQTLTITEVTANQAKAVSSGTITLAWTYVTGTNKGTIKLQPTGSLTETTYNIVFTLFPLRGAVTVL